MAEESAELATTAPHPHRPLPASTSPVASPTSLSLRPHQIPPPPPAQLPHGFVPRMVPLTPEPLRPLLKSVVVGGPFDLSSPAGLASDAEEVPETLFEDPVPELASSAFNAPSLASSAPGCGSAPAPVPPAAARHSNASIEDNEDGESPWQVVRNRRPEPPAPSSRPPAEARPRPRIPPHLRGLCFKCFNIGHFIADCTNKICCRRCYNPGHKERDCPQRRKVSQAPHCSKSAGQPPLCSGSPSAGPHHPLNEHAGKGPLCSGPPVAGPQRPPGRSWASVAAPPAACEDRGPPDRALLTTGCMSAGSATSPDATLRSMVQEQAAVVRSELHGLVASRLEELVQPLLVVTQTLQALLERLGSLVERAAVALEAPAVAQMTPEPPPLAESNGGLSDGGALEFYGCFSPRDVTISASLLAVTSSPLVASEALPIQQELVVESVVPLAVEDLKDCGTPSLEERTTKEVVLLDKENSACDLPTAKRVEYRRAELHEGVQELVTSAPTFIESITARITAPLLSAAPPTPATPIRRRPRNPAPMPTRQVSVRRAVTSMAGLSTVERARRVLRKKWGLPAEDEAKGDASEEVRQQSFMDLFKDPKTAMETEAVRALFGRVGSSRSVISKKAGRRATPTTAARAARAAEDLELEPPVEAHSRE